MDRYNELTKILEERRFFKIVCGAGNEDPEEVRRLTMVYALAGANCIDVSANVEVVQSAVDGLNKAEELAPPLGKNIRNRPFINVSVGLKGDPHIRKAFIVNGICTECGECRDRCLPEAIDNEFSVQELHCNGCGDCAEVCAYNAIEFYDKRVDLEAILPRCLENGAETLELHAASADDTAMLTDWNLVNSLVTTNFISMCLDRSLLSDTHLLKRIMQAYEITGERLMIQADGVPMSGSSNDYGSTLQAIAIAHIVQKSRIPVMLVASGGTNSKTGKLARLCGVDIHGVAIGTFARKIVKSQISRDDFVHNLELIGQAVAIAEQLVAANIET